MDINKIIRMKGKLFKNKIKVKVYKKWPLRFFPPHFLGWPEIFYIFSSGLARFFHKFSGNCLLQINRINKIFICQWSSGKKEAFFLYLDSFNSGFQVEIHPTAQNNRDLPCISLRCLQEKLITCKIFPCYYTGLNASFSTELT